MKVVLNIKVDKKLKHQAQKTAKALGVPLSSLIRACLRDFVAEKRMVFAVHPVPDKRWTAKILTQARAELKHRS